ncbi:gap junction protein alpha 10 a [Lampris incognitus]|uniref:gap junction protein alpha 10 a n=1 Tax=Lampris incognitus TaxID=2546036 RepID=UPI0024B53445|nr:gap junction protein alpha 10 a [Lampris incognitus]
MGDWNLLGSILEEVHIHSTIVGKIWLTILFIFRMLVLGVAAEDVWEDEQAEFICNTDQPGCKAVCYDRAFPISLIRFWVLQIIFVSAPSLVYMGHALYRIRTLEKERHRRRAQLREVLDETEAALEEHKRMERELKKLEEQRKVKKAPLRGSLLRTYIMHILTRSMVEMCFILGQYILYGVRIDPLFKCERLPCPNSVDCYVSRPTEKTIFMVFMIIIAGVSLFLNILEISHLGVKKIKQTLYGGKYLDEDSLTYKPKKKPTLQHLCVMRHLSPHNGPLTQTIFKVIPDAETKPPHLKANQEVPRDNSLALLGNYQPNCTNSQTRIPLQTSRSALGSAFPRTEGYPRTQVQHENLHQNERLHTSYTETLVSSSTMIHRPSFALREMEDYDRRDSQGTNLLLSNPRRTSFMARPPSETMSTISGSSNQSIHTSEESDELGSLQGDMPMMPPAGGRRMSMSVFLDISSIMKK